MSLTQTKLDSSPDRPGPRWLFWSAAATASVTLILLSIGGLVTSKGVGMSVPDWPTSYGYNMFLFPPSKWVGGIFHEHLHRLVASGVGFLTLALALTLHWKSADSVNRRLGWFAFGLVVFQGVLGGLRVVLDREAIVGTTLGTVFGMAHACTGQLFFVGLTVIALRQSRLWSSLVAQPQIKVGSWLRWCLPLGTALVFTQLLLGAAMRHQHAGLAIYDFPLAYGQWWPATDVESMFRYNQVRPDESTVTAFQIQLQMFHRIGACITLVTIFVCGLSARQVFFSVPKLARMAVIWMLLLVVQVSLGIATVLYNKPADVATAHVAVGALSLVCGTILSLAARRLIQSKHRSAMFKPRQWIPATAQ